MPHFKFIIEKINFLITSKNNSLIKRFRAFKDKLPSNEEDSFCVEGTNLIKELISSGNLPFKVIATEIWLNKNRLLANKISQSTITKVTEEVLSSATSIKNPDGVAALIKKTVIPKFSYEKKDDFILVLDRVQDPGNLGNLFRTALAAGVNKILLGGGANPLSPKVLRASCGSIFYLPYKRIIGEESKIINDLLSSLNDLSSKGFQIISTGTINKITEPTPKPYWELDWNKPTALILGNEGSGIHHNIKEAFNETITIPHSELVESLNVASVAVPLLLERKRISLTQTLKK